MRTSASAAASVMRMVMAHGGHDRAEETTLGLDDVYTAEIRRLIGLGTVLMSSRTAGEDLAHDAFLQVLRRVEREPGYLRSPAWPLLRTVLVRLAVQRRRAIARETRRLARFWEPPSSEWWDPDPALIDWQTALRALPPRMRACVVLFYGEDLNTADVAHALGCSPRTVEHQLHSARLKLSISPELVRRGEGSRSAAATTCLTTRLVR